MDYLTDSPWLHDEDRPRCKECHWVVKAHNNYKCLNSKCSLRNIEECKKIVKRELENNES